jgi:hypothetical protein
MLISLWGIFRALNAKVFVIEAVKANSIVIRVQDTGSEEDGKRYSLEGGILGQVLRMRKQKVGCVYCGQPIEKEK